MAWGRDGGTFMYGQMRDSHGHDQKLVKTTKHGRKATKEWSSEEQCDQNESDCGVGRSSIGG